MVAARGLAITHIGAESILSQEISEIAKCRRRPHPGVVIFHPKSISDLIKFCYLTRISERVLLLLGETPVDEIKKDTRKIKKILSESGIRGFVHKKGFKVECKLAQESGVDKNEIAGRIGEIVLDTVPSASVSLDEPDVILTAVVSEDKVYLGVDLCGFDLSRRDYRIFGHSRTIRATVAASLLRFGGFTSSLMDPFGGAGVIAIEAALSAANQPAHYHQKHRFAFSSMSKLLGVDADKIMEKVDKRIKRKKQDIIYLNPNHHHVASAKKNARIAGAEKMIEFRRQAIEWAELCCEKNSIDLIASQLPEKSRFFKKQTVRKLYKELFYQADYILRKNGRVAVIVSDEYQVRTAAKQRDFCITDTCSIMQGKRELKMILLKRMKEGRRKREVKPSKRA